MPNWEYPCRVQYLPPFQINGFITQYVIGKDVPPSYFQEHDPRELGLAAVPLGTHCQLDIFDPSRGFYIEDCINSTHGTREYFTDVDCENPTGDNPIVEGEYVNCGGRKCTRNDYVRIEVFEPDTDACARDFVGTNETILRTAAFSFFNRDQFCPAPGTNEIRCGDFWDGLLSDRCNKSDVILTDYATSWKDLDHHCVDLSPCTCRSDYNSVINVRVNMNCTRSCEYVGPLANSGWPMPHLHHWCDHNCAPTNNIGDRQRCHDHCQCTREMPPPPATGCTAIHGAVTDEWCEQQCVDFAGTRSEVFCDKQYNICDC